MKKKTNPMPAWGKWTIATFVTIILLTYVFLKVQKHQPKSDESTARQTAAQDAAPTTKEANIKYEIFGADSRLPYRQSFRIRIADRISNDELIALTKQIAKEKQIASEMITCHWWHDGQKVDSDACWANTKLEKQEVSVEYNGLSQQENLQVVDFLPQRDPNEIGLWFLEQYDTSHYVQPIRNGETAVELRTFFADGSKGAVKKEIKNNKPFRILWSEDWDEDEVFLEIDSGRAVLRNNSGVFETLKKIR